MAVEVNYNAADSGYSVPEDPNAQRKRDLQDEINELNGKISTLEGYRDAITEAQSNLKKEVIDPISAPYDLQEENKWRGAQYDVAKGMFDTIALTWVWCILVIIVSNTIAGRLVTMVTGSVENEIIKYAVLYLRVDTAFYFVPTLIALIRNSLQGCGDATTPVISSFIEFAGKLLIALFLAPLIGYWGIIVAEPIVWVLMVIPLLISMFKLLRKYSV